MDEEKQIEQMARITCQMYTPQYDKRCAGVGECDYKCLHYQRCEVLYAVGYHKQPEWISVEDRLPENRVNCIVYYKHAYCDNDGYWAIGVSFYDGNEFQIGLAYKVTHWMPIPAPPIEKEN